MPQDIISLSENIWSQLNAEIVLMLMMRSQKTIN